MHLASLLTEYLWFVQLTSVRSWECEFEGFCRVAGLHVLWRAALHHAVRRWGSLRWIKRMKGGKKRLEFFLTLTLKDVKQLHMWRYRLAESDPYLWCDTDCRAPRSCWGSWGNSVRWETGQGRRKGRRRRWSRAAEGRSPGRWRSGASGARCAGRRSGTLPAGCVEGWTRCDAGPAPAAALSGDRKDGRCCCKRSNYCFWLRNTVFDHCHRAPQKLHCYDIRILRWDYFLHHI